MIVVGIPSVDQQLRDLLWVRHAEIDGLENGAQHPLGGARILPGEFRSSRKKTAVILRPRAIRDTAEDDMADVAGAHLLKKRRRGEKGIDFPIDKKLRRVLGKGPIYIPPGGIVTVTGPGSRPGGGQD